MSDFTPRRRRRSGTRGRLSVSEGEFGALLSLAQEAVQAWLFSEVPIGPRPPDRDESAISLVLDSSMGSLDGVTLSSQRHLVVHRRAGTEPAGVHESEASSREDSEDEDFLGVQSSRGVRESINSQPGGPSPQHGTGDADDGVPNEQHKPPSLPAVDQGGSSSSIDSSGSQEAGGSTSPLGANSGVATGGGGPRPQARLEAAGRAAPPQQSPDWEQSPDEFRLGSPGGTQRHKRETASPSTRVAQSASAVADHAALGGASVGPATGGVEPPSSGGHAAEPVAGAPGKGTSSGGRAGESSHEAAGSLAGVRPESSGSSGAVSGRTGGSVGADGPSQASGRMEAAPGGGAAPQLRVQFRSTQERQRWAVASAHVDAALQLAQDVDAKAPHGKVPPSTPLAQLPSLMRLLTDLKGRMKTSLRAADEAFEARHARKPQREEKEPLRPLYQRYRDVKVAITGLEGRLARERAGRGAGGRGSSPRAGAASGRGSGGGGSAGGGSRRAGAGVGGGVGVPSAAGGSTPSSELEVLMQEKKALQLRLREFESQFRSQHGRAVRFHRDIAPVSEQYARYKEVKEVLRRAGMLPPAGSGGSGSHAASSSSRDGAAVAPGGGRLRHVAAAGAR